MPENVARQFDAKDSNGVGIGIVWRAVVGLSMFWKEKARKAVSHAIIVRRISTSGPKDWHILVNGQPPGRQASRQQQRHGTSHVKSTFSKDCSQAIAISGPRQYLWTRRSEESTYGPWYVNNRSYTEVLGRRPTR